MATFTIFDNAGAGMFMPYANVTAAQLSGATAELPPLLYDDGVAAVFDMPNTPIDVAVTYDNYGGGSFNFTSMGFYVGATAENIGQILNLSLPLQAGGSLDAWQHQTLNGGDDTMEGNNHGDQIHGGWGNDVVIGWAGDDDLYGDEGTDVLTGGGGNDYLNGGAGYDGALYLGNSWEYTFIRQSNGDIIVTDTLGDYGVDYLTGVEEIKFDNGRFSIDALAPLPLPVAIYGTASSNTLVGNTLNNKMYGYAGNDTLYGDNGNDTLYGDNGNDTIIGGFGDDNLIGGTGKDLLTGSGGLDRMIYQKLGDSGITFATRDVINTFAHGDKIDLSGIDANVKAAGNQAFSFVSAFTGAAGQLAVTKTSDTATVDGYFVTADVNGDKAADFSLQIYGAPALDKIYSWDFIL